MQAIWDQLEPTVVQIVGLALAALLAWIGMKVKELVGINIDAALRDSIRASMTTGAQAAAFQGLTGQDAVDATMAHVELSRPAELKKLDLPTPVLENAAKSKLIEAAVAITAAENSNTPGAAATVADKLP